MKSTEYFKSLVKSDETESSKRFITLVIAGIFILTQLLILIFTFLLIIYVPKGKVDPGLLASLENIQDKDFYIILTGLGFITADNLFQLILAKTKVRAEANVKTGSPMAETISVDTVNVKQELPVEKL